LKQAEQHKLQLAEEREKKRIQQKQARAAELKKRRKNAESDSLAALTRNATQRASAFEDTQDEVDDGASDLKLAGDRTRASYVSELRQVISMSDVLLVVLDARDPEGCRCRALEQMIMESDTRKRVILILNKIDLAPREAVQAWLKHLRLQLPTVAFKASTGGTRGKLSQGAAIKSSVSATSGECLGADMLIQLLKNYSRSHNIKKAISVGVVGYPNVGKSSLINSLKRSRAVGVSAQAGFTKTVQEVKLDKKVILLDSPGILLSASSDPENVLRNCVNPEQLEDVITPIESIINRCQKEQLLKAYQVADFSTTQEFLNNVAKKRGKLRKGGIVDLKAAARLILQDWNNGKVPFYTLPPAQKTKKLESVLVSEWGKEFDIGSFTQDVDACGDALPSDSSHVVLESKSNNHTLEEILGVDCDALMDDAEREDVDMDEDDAQDDGTGKFEMAL